MPKRDAYLAPVLPFAVGVTVAILLAVRSIAALTVPGVLHWDETYYASIAATIREGLGLYPFIQGYPQIPVMGGIGHVAYLYAWSIDIAGPSMAGMRTLSLIASGLGLVAVWRLANQWYGSGTGLVAVLVTAASTLFAQSNSIRLDAFVFCWTAWSLVLFARAQLSPSPTRWHLAVGLVAGLGLEVHLHTAISAIAIGVAYVYLGASSGGRCSPLRRAAPTCVFAAGYVLGASVFFFASVAPSPTAYVRSAGLTRLAMTGAEVQSRDDEAVRTLAATFFSPRAVVVKELERYRRLAVGQPRAESLLWLVSFVPLFGIRRHGRDPLVLSLVGGTLLTGGVLFNGESPIYLSHVLPLLLLPVAPLITHGFRETGGRPTGDLSRPASAAVVLLCVWALATVPDSKLRLTRLLAQAGDQKQAALAQLVSTRVLRSCHVAGDASLYVPYFVGHARFTSTRDTEVLIGSRYLGLQADLAQYWREKRPTVVFGDLPTELATTVRELGYLSPRPGIWIAPDRDGERCLLDSHWD